MVLKLDSFDVFWFYLFSFISVRSCGYTDLCLFIILKVSIEIHCISNSSYFQWWHFEFYQKLLICTGVTVVTVKDEFKGPFLISPPPPPILSVSTSLQKCQVTVMTIIKVEQVKKCGILFIFPVYSSVSLFRTFNCLEAIFLFLFFFFFFFKKFFKKN